MKVLLLNKQNNNLIINILTSYYKQLYDKIHAYEYCIREDMEDLETLHKLIDKLKK